MKKDDYWSYALEDCLDVVAKVPIIAAKIYRRTFHDGKLPEQLDGRGARVSARARISRSNGAGQVFGGGCPVVGSLALLQIVYVLFNRDPPSQCFWSMFLLPGGLWVVSLL